MNLTLSTCFVLVHDPDLALAFYRDALGLELRNDVAREDFRWITVGAPSQPGVGIVLTNYLNGSPADGDALGRARRQGRPERRPLPQRRPRRHLRKAARLRRRDRAGAHRAAVGHAGLRRARPVRQPGTHRPAARRLICGDVRPPRQLPRCDARKMLARLDPRLTANWNGRSRPVPRRARDAPPASRMTAARNHRAEQLRRGIEPIRLDNCSRSIHATEGDRSGPATRALVRVSSCLGARPREAQPTRARVAAHELAAIRSRIVQNAADSKRLPKAPAALVRTYGGGLSKRKSLRYAATSWRVSDGTRTHDRLDHNQELYQLSYAHRGLAESSSATGERRGLDPAPGQAQGLATIDAQPTIRESL